MKPISKFALNISCSAVFVFWKVTDDTCRVYLFIYLGGYAY